jgi:hypothetical protein
MASPDRERWLDGAVREVQSLFKRDSMEIVLKADCPSAEPLPSMFVCKKRNELNEVVVYKCRLVAGGHKQVEDVHYDPNDIYAPTVAQLTAKLIFEAAIQKTLGMLYRQTWKRPISFQDSGPMSTSYFGRPWGFTKPCSELASRYLPNTLTGFVCLLASMVSNKLQITGTMNSC